MNVRPLVWRRISGVLQSARAVGLNYYIQEVSTHAGAPRYMATIGGVLIYSGPNLFAGQAAAQEHFEGELAEWVA